MFLCFCLFGFCFLLVGVASTHSSESEKTESDQSSVACTSFACHGLNVSGRNALGLKTGSIRKVVMSRDAVKLEKVLRVQNLGNRSVSSTGGMIIISDLCGLHLNGRIQLVLWSGSKSVA